MLLDINGFDWNDGNYWKCQKHGVSIEEIEYLFRHEVFIMPDVKHSSHENRFLAVGKSCKERYIFVAFTIIQKDERHYIRPISVRYMHKKEIAIYEKETS